MNMAQLKQYIKSVLIKNEDKLMISPDLTIDRLFDNLSIDAIVQISREAGDGGDAGYQIVWDRYLLPVLMMADMYVKVFARESN